MWLQIFFIFIPVAICLCVILQWMFIRFLFWYLSWTLHRKHKINLKVKVGLFNLKELTIGFSSGGNIEVQKIWLSSCIFNSKYRSIISLCASNVDIKGDVQSWRRKTENKALPSTQKDPPSFLAFTRFLQVSIQVYHLKILQPNALGGQKFNLESLIEELVVSFKSSSSFHKRWELAFFLNKAKGLLYEDLSSAKKASVSLNLQCKLQVSRQPLVIEDFQLSLTHPEIVLHNATQLLQAHTGINLSHEIVDGPRRKKFDVLTVFPQNACVTVEDVLVKVIAGSNLSSRILTLHLQDACFKKEQGDDSIEGSFAIDNFSVLSADKRLAKLLKSNLEAKIIENVMEITSSITSCHLMYDYDELQFWRSLLPQRKTQKAPSKKRVWWSVLPEYKLQCQLDTSDTLVGMTLPDCSSFVTGLLHGRATFAVYPVAAQSKLVFSPREISLELLLETAWCHLDLEVNPLAMKRNHLWNTPLSFGMLFLKARDFPSDFRIQCMIDVVRAEWSPKLASLLGELNRYLENNKKLAMSSPENKSIGRSLEHCSLQITLSGINVFLLSERGPGLMLRVDSTTFDTEKHSIAVDGWKITTLTPSNESFQCLKSSELTNSVQHVATARVSYRTENKEISLQLEDEFSCYWTTAVHMTVVCLAEEITSAIKNFKKNRVSTKKVSSPLAIFFHLTVEGKVSVTVVLSKEHRFSVITSEITAKVHPGRTSLQSDLLRIDFDGHPIFTLVNFSLSSIQEDEQYIISRHSFEALEQAHNKAWNIKMDELRIVFPYEYVFAEAFNEQAVGIVKWLKIVHKRTKSPFTEESPLPPDLTFKIKVFSVEVGDDPFEVKLKYNYELLEDEYHESLKRRAMLDEKVEKLRMTHLLLPSEKLEELYVSLSKKNADIYIQRSRQLYSEPMRTSIFTWQMENVDLMAVADTSYHGTQKVVQHTKDIDPDSPYPEEGIEFVTLWCRKVNGSVDGWSFHLRDFPQPMLEAREFHIWGRLIGAEEAPLKRAKRSSVVEVDEPWGNVTVERSMPSLKFFHDLTWDLESLCMAHGPCWDTVVAQAALNMENISKPSLDPSPALPWWDKMRLLFHGRLTLSVQHLTALMQASPDPYNTTEQMEISWSDVIVDWVNAKIMMKGDLDIYVHTASKYDDCRLLHVPNVKLSFKLEWLCLGNPNDHHGVMPCAPDKVPEYSSNQVHDSFRAFRSHNLNISVALETKSVFLESEDDVPSMLLYNSTLRWLENLKFTLGGVSRLTRRGILFNNTKPRKPQLGRHYRTVRLSVNLHKSQICCWSSTARLRGFEVLGGRLSLGSEHTLSLKPVTDGLKHRHSADWETAYLTCDLADSEIWLHKSLIDSTAQMGESLGSCIERGYFVSMTRVSYGREAKLLDIIQDEGYEDPPTHRLVVHGLRGAWTKNNRDVVFELFDSFTKAKLLKRNLSTEALKGVKVDGTLSRSRSATATPQPISAASPLARLQSGHVAGMLQKLIAEAEANPTVYTEEIEGGTREQQLYGVAACQTDDVLCKNWLVELVNSQVMLQGVETLGYVIVSAARTEILTRCHRPVWKDRTLKSKTTWVGSVECLQYYATVDAGQPCPSLDNIMWLSVDNIEEKSSFVISDPPDLVGSGQSVGGVVSSTVGGASLQLQRIISRCGCHFFYASFGENVDSAIAEEVPPLPEDNDLFDQEVAVDSFTLTHHDLTICTNSLQYAMILDILNNLLLYVEPRRKEASERLQRMRFRLQLSAIEDRRGPVLQLQDQVRTLVLNLRRLEREMHMARRSMSQDEELLRHLENDAEDCKERLTNASEDLAIMISCFKEAQIKTKQRAAVQQDGRVAVVRRSEVCFKFAQWRLTDADGQLGIAGLELANFLYSKITKDDDSVEHLCEVGCIRMSNLLPNQIYKDVLQPTELQPNIPLDRQRALRVYCRERAPVGGISVKEHFEVNVIPITISLTSDFFTTMIKFFFPGRDAEKADYHDDEDSATKNKKKTAIPTRRHDDIEKMKERAERNHTFLYIKIPEVPLRVSYKGEKEKNIRDLHDYNLTLPTLEYHNQTWTWLDLLMAMKNDTKRFLLPQAIKQKLQIKSSHQASEESSQPQEEDKARLLLGSKLLGGPEKTTKKSIFKLNK